MGKSKGKKGGGQGKSYEAVVSINDENVLNRSADSISVSAVKTGQNKSTDVKVRHTVSSAAKVVGNIAGSAVQKTESVKKGAAHLSSSLVNTIHRGQAKSVTPKAGITSTGSVAASPDKVAKKDDKKSWRYIVGKAQDVTRQGNDISGSNVALASTPRTPDRRKKSGTSLPSTPRTLGHRKQVVDTSLSSALRTPDRAKKHADNVASSDRSESNYEHFYIGDRNRKYQHLPENFTSLAINTGRKKASDTPERAGGNNTRTSRTAPAILLYKLYEAANFKESTNQELAASGSEEKVNGNIACAQLSIIPHDPEAPDLYLNITSSNSNGESKVIVTPSELYGKSQQTFPHFANLYRDYLDDQLLKDPVVLSILGPSSHHDRSQVQAKGHKIREKTHHSEQFFIAAIYKSLKALKEAGTEISNATFILDIATYLAPCNNCVDCIKDFFNYIRNEMMPDNNYFVVRISWLKEYNRGNSPSDASRLYDNRQTPLVSDAIEISDPEKNYVLFFKADKEIAINSNVYATNSGRSAQKSSAILSSNSKTISSDQHLTRLSILTDSQSIGISPPRFGSTKKRSPAQNKSIRDALSTRGTFPLFCEEVGKSSITTSSFKSPNSSIFDDDMISLPPRLQRRQISGLVKNERSKYSGCYQCEYELSLESEKVETDATVMTSYKVESKRFEHTSSTNISTKQTMSWARIVTKGIESRVAQSDRAEVSQRGVPDQAIAKLRSSHEKHGEAKTNHQQNHDNHPKAKDYRAKVKKSKSAAAEDQTTGR